MKKPHWSKMLASELLADTRVLDQSAETIHELMEKTGLSRSSIMARIKEQGDKLEQVCKREGGAIVLAYRTAKSK